MTHALRADLPNLPDRMKRLLIDAPGATSLLQTAEKLNRTVRWRDAFFPELCGSVTFGCGNSVVQPTNSSELYCYAIGLCFVADLLIHEIRGALTKRGAAASCPPRVAATIGWRGAAGKFGKW